MERRSSGEMAARVLALVAGTGEEPFEELALDLFRDHCEDNPGYAEACRRSGVEPESVTDWRQVPALSTHGHASRGEHAEAGAALPALERAVVDATLGALVARERPATLALVAAVAEAPDPRQAARANHLLERGATASARACGVRGVDFKAARSWLAARQRHGEPALVVGGRAALERLASSLERLDLRFRLTPGSRLVELAEAELGPPSPPSDAASVRRLGERLALRPQDLVVEYAPAGVVTGFYAAGDGERWFTAPPWTRVRCLDPETGQETSSGKPGRLAVLDLAALDAPVPRLTDERGMAGEGGAFRVVGAAAGDG